MNKVYVDVTIRLVLNTDGNFDLKDTMNEMDYTFTDMTGNCDVIDTEMINYTVIDAK